MDRRLFLSGAALTCISKGFSGQVPHHVSKALESSKQGQAFESDRRIRKATAAAMALQRLDWEQGILAQAMLEAGLREQVVQLTRAAMVLQAPDGRVAVEISGSPTDPTMGGAAYAKAAEWTVDPKIQSAVEGLSNWVRFKAPRNPEGILYHVFGAPEMWSDGFNAAPPFLAAKGHYDEALAQIDGFWKKLWNPEKQLLSHIWDDGKHEFRDRSFWGGGNGWAVAGLARVIRSLPGERVRDRERLATFAHQITDGCLQYQRSDGLFHNVVDQPETFVETNLTQMLAYAIYEGVTAGWLPESYRSRADTMRAAARKKMDDDGFVRDVCGAPKFDSPGISTEGQAFCIMMEAASRRTATPLHAQSRNARRSSAG
jgi:rhamnogalacturonyl hydrolase YesR